MCKTCGMPTLEPVKKEKRKYFQVPDKTKKHNSTKLQPFCFLLLCVEEINCFLWGPRYTIKKKHNNTVIN